MLERTPIPKSLMRPVEVRAFDMAEEHKFTSHAHDWGQFTYSAEGVLTVFTPQGRFTAPPAMAVLLDRIGMAEPAALNLPLSRDARLRTVMEILLENPADRRCLEAFARQAGASARTLARLFRSETGMNFGDWRRRRTLLAALERLSEGQAVTTIALDLGYESPSAFIAMFRKTLGASPTHYFKGGCPG